MARHTLRSWWRKIWLPLSDSHGPHKPDYILLIVSGVVILFGLVMLSSATAYFAYNNKDYGDTYYFLKQQITRGLIPGLILYFIFIRLPYQKLKKLGWWWLIISIVLLSCVLIPGLGREIHNSRSWLGVGSIAIQTSEIAKLTFIIFLAFWLERQQRVIADMKATFWPFLVFLGIVATLLFLQPDIGTLLIFVAIAATMYFAAGMTVGQMITLLVLSLGGLGLAVRLAPYRLQRLVTFLNPNYDTQGAGYQLKQALIAIGSGGLWGLGLGQSRQKFNYLPEVAADSIFAVIAEEWGWISSVLLIILFITICIRGLRIAKYAPDTFAKLLTIGIIGWITIQAAVNIAAIIGLMPLTGLPLPFISLGGSNLAVVMMALAIVTNISKYTLERS
ncbi:MAG: putative lipid II flippase FtsW [Candidatus Komeilibacteria bacterium]